MESQKNLICEFVCLLMVFCIGCIQILSAGDRMPESAVVMGGEQDGEYIRWVDFNVTAGALNDAYEWDVNTYEAPVHLNWIELLAFLAACYGGSFDNYKKSDMDALAQKLVNGHTDMEELTEEMEYYSYYLEAYSAVLGGMVGEYERLPSEITEDECTDWEKTYGLKAFNPIAKNFAYTDYDDFGVSRSYGYERKHLGHDMMGAVGTPVVAVESGYVYALGWNQYGGWRIGINSFDGRRYYYYAHLRKDRPYAAGLKEGDVVYAGDVIGYMGRTGYSATENVNNIEVYHLHFGMQLIFDESQREGNNEIWIDVYPIVQFLSRNRSEVYRDDKTKEWYRAGGLRETVSIK